MNNAYITTITEFIEFIKSADFNVLKFGHNLWLRAENSSYSKSFLTPNLFREYILGPSTTQEFFVKEWSLRTLFKNEAYPFLRQHNVIDSDLGVTFIMQHYGSQTRLLDWTENSLISLFFAVENIYDQNDAIIWVLDPFKLNSSTTKFVQNFETEELKLYPSIEPVSEVSAFFQADNLKSRKREVKYPIALKPFYIDERMKNQSSCFTLFGFDMKGLLEHPHKHDFLTSISIPYKSFREIKRDLYKLGISYDSVYPKIEGISKKTVYAYDEYFI